MTAPAPAPTATRAAAPSRLRRAGWLAMTLLATLVAVLASRYFTLDPEAYFPEQRLVYLAHQGPLLLHVTGSVLALLLGPWQFVRRLRTRRPAVHRVIGRLYVLSVLAGGVGGLLLAPRTYSGPVARVGFAMLAVLVLTATAVAFRHIRRRDIPRHRAWMIRSYALIFTGVTFRLWLGAGSATGLAFEDVYASGSWASWMINLAVAEWLISRSRRPSWQEPRG